MSKNYKALKKVEIINRMTNSGYDTYTGVVNGRKVSIDVIRSECDQMSDKRLENYVKQGLVAAKDYEDGKDGGVMERSRHS